MRTKEKGKIWKKIRIVLTIIFFTIVVVGLPIGLSLLIPQSLWNKDNMLSLISLFIAAYTLEATILIAIVIYIFQKQDMVRSDKQRLDKARVLVLAELETALSSFLFTSKQERLPGVCSGTKEIVYNYLPDLQDYLSHGLFEHLLNIINLIDAAVNVDEEDMCDLERLQEAAAKLLLRPWLFEIMNSEFRTYYMKAYDYHNMLNIETFNLLNALSGINHKYENDMYIIGDKGGHVLFEKRYDNTIRIYNGDGLIIAEGLFGLDDSDDLTIVDGYKKSGKYDGYYKNGKYDGQGTLYGFYGRKLKEGIWKQGELEQGIEFDWVIKKDGEDIEEYEQVGEDILLSMMSTAIEYEGLEHFFVSDCHVKGKGVEYFNIRPLEEYLEKNNPKCLEYFNKMTDYEEEPDEDIGEEDDIEEDDEI